MGVDGSGLDAQHKTGTVSPETEPAERGEGPPEGLDEVEVGELVEVNEGLQYFEVEVVPAGVISHTRVSTPTSQKGIRSVCVCVRACVRAW